MITIFGKNILAENGRWTKIPASAFEGRTDLTTITIPNYITSIGKSAFKSCTELTSVTIPEGVTEIGDGAFYSELPNLDWTDLVLPSTLNNAPTDAFNITRFRTFICNSDKPLRILTYGWNSDYTLRNTFEFLRHFETNYLGELWHPWSDRILVNNNAIEKTSARDNCLFDDGSKLQYFKGFFLPFYFYGTDITSDSEGDEYFTLDPDSSYYKKIYPSYYKYGRPSALETIVDLDTSVRYTPKKESVSVGDRQAIRKYKDYTQLKTLELPNILSLNCDDIYTCTSLTTLKLGTSLTNISGDCPTALTNITYDGTMSDWNNVTKAANFNSTGTVKTITCTDGTITL